MLKKLLSGAKAKALAVVGGLSLGAVNSVAADITMAADGTVSGTFNLTNLYVVGAAVFAAVATVAVLSLSIKFLRKAG